MRAGSADVYRDDARKWRWRLKTRNGRIIADSGQGYADKRNAILGLEVTTGCTYELLGSWFTADGHYQQGQLFRWVGDYSQKIHVDVLP